MSNYTNRNPKLLFSYFNRLDRNSSDQLGIENEAATSWHACFLIFAV
jgi:hypothetical protein